ncbi:MAG: rod shape-determining protein [Bacteroidetes bacterium]|nr:rod shape-determining protein [Bacteroidota bacterium]
MKIRKFAAIDIGSNAIRLLISNILEVENKEPAFRKNALVRVPIRLGADSFTVGEISKINLKRMVDTMKAFKLLMQAHGVEKYMACATSAMREATNSDEVVDLIKEKSGIDVQIIDGKTEATIIANTDLQHFLDSSKNYLYVDVGGGSTEFTIFSEGKIMTSKSFRMGTVRMISQSVEEMVWDEIKKWLRFHTKEFHKIDIIGSGGNINKLYKMSGITGGKPLTYLLLNAEYERLLKLSFEERILQFNMNPDRADVIIPATKIFLFAAKWSGATDIHVPKIGLADGIIKAMYKGQI